LNNIRLIYVSSWETYSGYRADELIADEALPLFPRGSYGESKWMSEQLIGHYHKIYGLRNNILRSSPIYGENSDRPKFIYNFIDKAKSNKDIITHKYLNGDPKLDLLYVDDFVSALKKVISFKEVKDFNLGSGRLISTREIAEMIIELTGSKSVVGSKSIDSFYSNIRIDSTRAKNLLGWEPGSTVETALKKLLQ
jgi:nucleoside-diphosphate-sugar epimerase